jgi:histone H3/H4
VAALAREAQASAEANKRKTVMDGDIEAARAKLAVS